MGNIEYIHTAVISNIRLRAVAAIAVGLVVRQTFSPIFAGIRHALSLKTNKQTNKQTNKCDHQACYSCKSFDGSFPVSSSLAWVEGRGDG